LNGKWIICLDCLFVHSQKEKAFDLIRRFYQRINDEQKENDPIGH